MTPARQAARAFYLAAKSELVRADQPHGVRAIAAIVKCDALPQYTTPNGRLESWAQVCRWVMRWNEYAKYHDMAQLELRVGPTISCGHCATGAPRPGGHRSRGTRPGSCFQIRNN